MTPSKLTVLSRSLMVAGALAALGVTATASAAPQSDAAPSITVRYNDLNLATQSGIDALYARISVAARQVCPVADYRVLNSVSASDQCRAEAVAHAVQKVNNPKLAVLHTARVSRG
jgi:UrcA family protein